MAKLNYHTTLIPSYHCFQGTDCYLGPSPECKCFCPTDEEVGTKDICRSSRQESMKRKEKNFKQKILSKASLPKTKGKGPLKGKGKYDKLRTSITSNDVTWELEQKVSNE